MDNVSHFIALFQLYWKLSNQVQPTRDFRPSQYWHRSSFPLTYVYKINHICQIMDYEWSTFWIKPDFSEGYLVLRQSTNRRVLSIQQVIEIFLEDLMSEIRYIICKNSNIENRLSQIKHYMEEQLMQETLLEHGITTSPS